MNVSLLNGSSTPGARSAFRERLIGLGAQGVIVRHNALNDIQTARFLLDGPAQLQVTGRAERLVRTALEGAHIQAKLLMLGAAHMARG